MQVLHEINLLHLWQLVRSNWKAFTIATISTGIFMFAIGSCIPRTYQSEVKLAPETNGSNLSGNLSSLTSMMGLKANALGDEDAILPELYPDVMSSPDFMLSLLEIKVSTKDNKVKNVSYKTYLTQHCDAPWWTKLVVKLTSAFEKKEEEKSVVRGAANAGPIMLSKKDTEILKAVEGALRSQVDKKTDVITISAAAQDPLVATILVDSVSDRLQQFITNYRTQKARKDAAYVEDLVEKAKEDYEKAQREYAAYSDAHAGLVLNEYKVKLEDLENDLQLKYNVYSQLVVQLQNAKAKVLERTPVYTTIQAPMVPYRHIAPRRSFYLLFGMVMGFFVTFLVVYYQERKKVA